jgi:cytoskeletal protein CcmA (bactofilin family)
LPVSLLAKQSAKAVSILNNQGQLPAGQTINDDLIISGDKVSVDGTVNGLVIASGNTVAINGTVNGDLFAFGSQVVIGPQAVIKGNVFSGAREVETLGLVEGSFFTGSMSLKLNQQAQVARNLFFGGYNFSSSSGSSIGRDFMMGGYQAVIDGSVGQNLRVDGGAVQINGKIGGDATLNLSGSDSDTRVMNSIFKSNGVEMPEALPVGLTIAPNATIRGKLTYTSPVKYDASDSKV